MSGWDFSIIWRCNVAAVVAAAALAVFVPVEASAQTPAQPPGQFRSLTLPPQPPAPAPFAPFAPPAPAAPSAPNVATPSVNIAAPTPLAPPPPPPAAPTPPAAQAVAVPAGHVALAVAARYGRDAPPISGGLIWRVYAAKPDGSGVFRLLKEDHGAAPTFVLPPGNYVVDASLGLASAAKAVALRSETVHEMFEIPAGGVRLEGRVGDVRIPAGQISFAIFTGSQFDATERRPIAQNVISGDVVLFPKAPTTSCRITATAMQWCAPTCRSRRPS